MTWLLLLLLGESLHDWRRLVADPDEVRAEATIPEDERDFEAHFGQAVLRFKRQSAVDLRIIRYRKTPFRAFI